MDFQDNFMEYENNTFDIDNFKENVRIKPDFYLHIILLQLTKVFEGEVTEVDGFKKFNHLVGYAEVICRASNLLPKNYDEKVKNLKENAAKEFSSRDERNSYLAREKLNLFIGNVFDSAPARGPLQLYTNQDGTTSSQRELYENVQAKKELLKEKELEDEKA